ncbi:CAP domain-containing protein [Halobacillus sp. Marseille-Q1614]|uniref:CAP domain-containing protein n=1 Tax=Halobacillus sp. Marseille-Q1614 TaxID=2709134 RepID=UPI00157145F5|nr:CAP domain-containing protein [Halobacillus sp. Marseille-Q1614]
MLRKYLFVFLAVLFMVSVATPALAEQLWKSNENHTATLEKWTGQLKGWFSKQDISIEEFQTNLERLFNPSSIPEEEMPQQRSEELEGNKNKVSEGQEGEPAESLIAQDPSEFEKEVVELVNEERAKEGLKPLKMYERLSDLARLKSEDMAERNYFDHTSPTYGSPFEMMDQYEFKYWSAGENIAAGQRSPEQVMEGWMNSPGHRENIMKKEFTHIGVGYVEGSGSYGTYWTQMFMTPR